MTTKSRKVIGTVTFEEGKVDFNISDPEHGGALQKLIERYVEKHNSAPEEMIRHYESGAEEILKENGFTVSGDNWRTYKPNSPIAQDALKVLENLKALKMSLKKNDARFAALWGALVAVHAARIKIRPFVHDIDKYRNLKKSPGRKRISQQTVNEWQKEINKLHNSNPNRSHWALAGQVAQKFSASHRTLYNKTKIK